MCHRSKTPHPDSMHTVGLRCHSYLNRVMPSELALFSHWFPWRRSQRSRESIRVFLSGL